MFSSRTERELVALLCPGNEQHRMHITAEWLPNDFEIRTIFYDHLSMCFEIIVTHPSFAPVPDGERCPYLGLVYAVLTKD